MTAGDLSSLEARVKRDLVRPNRAHTGYRRAFGWHASVGIWVVLGALWTVQGLGYVDGSVMTDERAWAVIGPVVILIGLVALWYGMRARRRRG